MPNNLRELYVFIQTAAKEQGLSRSVTFCAVGRVFHEIFERADHEEKNNGCTVTSVEIDRYVKETPPSKLQRDIDQSSQDFGSDAYDLMEPQMEDAIRRGIDESILERVKGYTSGWKMFGMNVLAGLVSGLLFAAISFGLYLYVKADPSVNDMGKHAVTQSDATPPPASPPRSPAR